MGSTYHIDDDFLNLKAQYNGPDQTQDQPGIAVHNVLSTNGLQAYLQRRALVYCVLYILTQRQPACLLGLPGSLSCAYRVTRFTRQSTRRDQEKQEATEAQLEFVPQHQQQQQQVTHYQSAYLAQVLDLPVSPSQVHLNE